MTLLVFGRTGQVATELARLAPGAVFLGREAADLANPNACADAILAHAPAAVINAAAYTAVDQAEREEPLVSVVNGTAPGAMARACAALGVPLVHLSTDYVFDGSGMRGWRAEDPPAPLSAYGRSKLAGERAVAEAGGIHAILRTSWVFSAHGSNFLRTMLRMAQTRDALGIVDDQWGGPTAAADIATACLTIVEALLADPRKAGLYHYSGAPDVSWKDFADAIFASAARGVAVTGIPTAEYLTPAPRPRNSRLDCTSTETTFGLVRPDWRRGLHATLVELGEISE